MSKSMFRVLVFSAIAGCLGTAASLQLAAAPPETTGAECKSSSCTNAIHLTESGGAWVDGCKKDALGACVRSITDPSSVCYTCTGAASPTDLCFHTGVATDMCTAAGVGSWTYHPCGTKDKRRCATGGSGPSGCCDTGVLLTTTTDACVGPKCSKP